MLIRVRLFARLQDVLGPEVAVDMPDGATAGQLRASLATRHRNLESLIEHSAIAINEEFAEDTAVIHANDEVALIPPVSGGGCHDGVGDFAIAHMSAHGRANPQAKIDCVGIETCPRELRR